MSTNYYGKIKINFPIQYEINSINELKRVSEDIELLLSQEKIHLGKSYIGWNFLAQLNDGKFYNDTEEYYKFIETLDSIEDEYENVVTVDEFKIITRWQGKRHEYSTKLGNLEFYNGDWC